MSTPMATDAPPAAPSTAEVLLSAMNTLTNAVAALVRSMTGFVPRINQLIKASKEVKTSNEALSDTLDVSDCWALASDERRRKQTNDTTISLLLATGTRPAKDWGATTERPSYLYYLYDAQTICIYLGFTPHARQNSWWLC